MLELATNLSNLIYASVAEQADAADLKSAGGKPRPGSTPGVRTIDSLKSGD